MENQYYMHFIPLLPKNVSISAYTLLHDLNAVDKLGMGLCIAYIFEYDFVQANYKLKNSILFSSIPLNPYLYHY